MDQWPHTGGDDEQPKALPIACTLTPGDLRERLGAIRTLTREALLGYERDGLNLALRYAPDAIERVRAMVTAEQHCCAFLEFEVREQTDCVHVMITTQRLRATPRTSFLPSSSLESNHTDEHRDRLCARVTRRDRRLLSPSGPGFA